MVHQTFWMAHQTFLMAHHTVLTVQQAYLTVSDGSSKHYLILADGPLKAAVGSTKTAKRFWWWLTDHQNVLMLPG